jgi:hypothetical protein
MRPTGIDASAKPLPPEIGGSPELRIDFRLRPGSDCGRSNTDQLFVIPFGALLDAHWHCEPQV